MMNGTLLPVGDMNLVWRAVSRKLAHDTAAHIAWNMVIVCIAPKD